MPTTTPARAIEAPSSGSAIDAQSTDAIWAWRSSSPVVLTVSGLQALFTTGVSSFAGRGGAITPTSGDYTADQITETASHKILTSAERARLAGMQDGAQVNPASLDEVPDSATRVAMLATERTKLSGITPLAQPQPTRVSEGDIATPVGTSPVGWSPSDMAAFVAAHGTALTELDGGESSTTTFVATISGGASI